MSIYPEYVLQREGVLYLRQKSGSALAPDTWHTQGGHSGGHSVDRLVGAVDRLRQSHEHTYWRAAMYGCYTRLSLGSINVTNDILKLELAHPFMQRGLCDQKPSGP